MMVRMHNADAGIIAPSRMRRPEHGEDREAAGRAEELVPPPFHRKGARRRLLIVLPYQMSARTFIHSDVAACLADHSDLDITYVTRDAADRSILGEHGEHVRWLELPRPFRRAVQDHGPSASRKFGGDMRLTLGFYLHLMLVFRFCSIQGFRGFRDRLRQSSSLRKQARQEGLALQHWMGFPFPHSRRLFNILRGFYFRRWQRHPGVECQFDSTEPDVLVLGHLQNPWVTPYVLAAKARGIPIMGVNGSWDQPTTKGPLCAGISHILVQSRQVAADLATHHGVTRGAMTVVGWPQMDIYARPATFLPRHQFLEKIGLPPDSRYILIGAYSQRLGAHEPEMCRRLAAQLATASTSQHVAIYVRSHPLDLRWRERLGDLHRPPAVIVEPPQDGDLEHLANLLKHADMLIASAGTINLDAVAVDTPSIAIAWESEEEPYFDRPARRYDMEHYAAVVRTGGIRLVHSWGELEATVEMYLGDRSIDAPARARLREEHLAPLDGLSSERLAAAIAVFAPARAVAAAP